MKIRVEILRWEKSGEEPRILYSLSHESHSLLAIKHVMESILESVSLPEPPHGYKDRHRTGHRALRLGRLSSLASPGRKLELGREPRPETLR